MDEARFGRMNRPVRCWAPAGVRPVVDCQTVREYTYAYGALCPDDGALDSLILPSMHSECFGYFVSEISRRYPEELIVMGLRRRGVAHRHQPIAARERAHPHPAALQPRAEPHRAIMGPDPRAALRQQGPTTAWTKSKTTSPRNYAPSKPTTPQSNPSPAINGSQHQST